MGVCPMGCLLHVYDEIDRNFAYEACLNCMGNTPTGCPLFPFFWELLKKTIIKVLCFEGILSCRRCQLGVNQPGKVSIQTNEV